VRRGSRDEKGAPDVVAGWCHRACGGFHQDRRHRFHGTQQAHENSYAALTHYSFGDLAGNIGQPKIAALETVSESFMIDAAQVEHRRMQIVYVHFLSVST